MRWVAFAMLLPLSLAGCAEEKAAATDDSGEDPLDAIGNGTAGLNLRPLPSFDADVLEGAAPLLVNFSLDGADPNEDALNWTLDADGDGSPEFNGTVLPASVNYTYVANGTYNATFVLGDGNLTAQTTLVINVTGDAPAAADYAPQPPVTFTGSLAGAGSAGPAGTATHTFEVGPGQRLIHGTLAYGTGCAGDIDWALLNPTGAEADSAGSFSPNSEGALDAENPAPGTWSVRIEAFAAACASYTATIAFE